MTNPFEDVKLKSKPLLLDGAVGSYLQQQGFATDDLIWTTNINLSNPEAVVHVHEEYITAGADIITTNTFRTNPSSLIKFGINNVSSYVAHAVKLAKQALDGRRIYIAGSNAPAEDCYQIVRNLSDKELQTNHYKHVDLLIDNGVDFILNETQSHFDEIKIICEHCDRMNIPYAISLYLDEECNLLSGESLRNTLLFLNDHNPLAIGFNCIRYELLKSIIGSTVLPVNWGFYLNCGSGNPTDQIIECGVEPEVYSQYVETFLIHKPIFVGSCCGSSPKHTKRIRELLDERNYN